MMIPFSRKSMGKKKKIAIVSNTSWSVYNFRLGLIRRLQEIGYEISIIAPQDNFSAKLVAEGFHFHHIYTNNYSTNPLNDLRTLFQLKRIYQKNKFDFIFHYTIKPNIYGTLAARWCKIPSIAITTGLGRLFSFNNKIVKFLSTKLYQIAARYSQQVW
ncbi:MAG: glycosyltransferase, partial [Saprospiraceae bacterium]